MQRGKRWPFAVLLAIGVLTGCSKNTNVAAGPVTACTAPRPEACPRNYEPVCGSAKEGGAKTYGNACEACADATVVSWAPGECP